MLANQVKSWRKARVRQAEMRPVMKAIDDRLVVVVVDAAVVVLAVLVVMKEAEL